MSKSQLIPLRAASPTPTALAINPRATDRELAELGKTLAQVEGARQWWLGDYGIELQRRKRAELKKLKPTLTDEQLDAAASHYTHERAEALAIDPGSWRNCVMVARFYAPSFRHDGPHASFAHHYTAMLATGAHGDTKAAVAWVIKAIEREWSVSDLRRAIAEANATARPPEAPAEANPFAPLDEADHWAITQQDVALTPDLARACLTRFAALVAWLDRLRATAAQGQPSDQRAEVGNQM